MDLFGPIQRAAFISRPNRFLVECLVRGRKVRAYLPNPGRLWELLFPGVALYLTKFPPSPERKYKYLAVAVERDGIPVMLHTHRTNSVAAHLLRHGRVPGLEGAEIVQPEYRVGNSRFDFLLRKDGRDLLLEVKSCTLFHDSLAMFPDAVSARATKHLLELEELSRRGYDAAALFIVHSPRVRWFMPEHHTDLEFTRTICHVRRRIMVRAVSVGWERDLSLRRQEPGNKDNNKTTSRRDAELAEKTSHLSPLCPPRVLRETALGPAIEHSDTFVRELTIPWELVEREAHDRGAYLIVLRLPRRRTIRVGSLGQLTFPKGYYVYVGSAMKDLTRRIARHQRLIKRFHWHIDYLRAEAEFVAGIPVRSGADRECGIAASLAKIAGWQVAAFGSSDCSCATHLFGLQQDPFLNREFIAMLLLYRMGKLEEELRAN